MPEGLELHLASRFINKSCRGRTFGGRIAKSDVHKSDNIGFRCASYTISARSRGKEIQLNLCSVDDYKNKPLKNSRKIDRLSQTTVLFRFGMSGKFEFTLVSEVHKHAHLKFYTKDSPQMVLSYVDVRRFGRFEETTSWGKGRGPDPMFEYQDFRKNVLSNQSSSEFERPICEVLLNQKYFNGIGNYLRAEILHRSNIPPFEQARKVLEGLPELPPDVKPKVKGRSVKTPGQTDILHLCHTVPLEVVNLGSGGYDPEGNQKDYNKFTAWLQCYYQPGMKNMVDHNSRTIWFSGPAGPLAPKGGQTRSTGKKKSSKRQKPKKTKEQIAEGSNSTMQEPRNRVVKRETSLNGAVPDNSSLKRPKVEKTSQKVAAGTKKRTPKPYELSASLRRSGRLKNSRRVGPQ